MDKNMPYFFVHLKELTNVKCHRNSETSHQYNNLDSKLIFSSHLTCVDVELRTFVLYYVISFNMIIYKTNLYRNKVFYSVVIRRDILVKV